MTEQLNQVYAYLLKIEEASRKDVTGIQFAFEAGGYAKAAMAICESALNWPKHSNVEVQAKRKTPFDFGATRIPPKHGDSYWSVSYWEPSDKNEIFIYQWHSDKIDFQLLHKGSVFLYEAQCLKYCDYLNSLSNEE